MIPPKLPLDFLHTSSHRHLRQLKILEYLSRQRIGVDLQELICRLVAWPVAVHCDCHIKQGGWRTQAPLHYRRRAERSMTNIQPSCS